MRNILNTYITPKNYSVSDINTHYFNCGLYEVKEGKEYYYLNIKTEENFFDAISDVQIICDEIKNCVSNYCSSENKDLKIEIWIENSSNWSIPVYPLENKICLGLNNDIPIDEALKFCKDFNEIYIGGYRGYKVSVPEDFSSCFDGFDNLKLLQIDDFQTEEDKNRAKKLSEVLYNVTLIIDFEKIQQL